MAVYVEGTRPDDLASTYSSALNNFKKNFKDWVKLHAQIVSNKRCLTQAEILKFEQSIGIVLPPIEQAYLTPIPVQRVVAGRPESTPGQTPSG